MVSKTGINTLYSHWIKFCWVSALAVLLTSIFFAASIHKQMNNLDKSLQYLRYSAQELSYSVEERVKREISMEESTKLSSRSKKTKRSAIQIDVKEEQYFVMDGGGTAYIRWGRRDCPEYSLSTLIYSGYAAGTHYTHAGGGSNYICIDGNITYSAGHFDDGNKGASHVYGVEVRDGTWIHSLFDLSDRETNNFHMASLPCAMCLSNTMLTQIMIPDRETCPNGWNLEYRGFIMAASHGDTHASQYICVDEKPHVVPGTHANEKGSSVYVVEPQCTSLLCEPFVVGRELRCVVCTF